MLLARPLKLGLDYFPLDVNIDDNVELLEAECGLEGFAILVKLWQKIYSNSYYIEWNEDIELLFSRKINADRNKVNSVVNACLRRNIFDKDMYDKYSILTSRGIQKRYVLACSSSKRKSIVFEERFLLLEGELTRLITELIPLTQEESTQRKGKESKVKEIKELQEDSSSFSSHDELSATEEKDNKDFKELAQLYQKCGFQVNGLTPQWLEEILNVYGFEWCKNAIEESEKRGKRTKKYVEAILQNWNKNGGMKLGGEQTGSIASNGGANKKYDVSRFINQ